jgi:hypothetical protein
VFGRIFGAVGMKKIRPRKMVLSLSISSKKLICFQDVPRHSWRDFHWFYLTTSARMPSAQSGLDRGRPAFWCEMPGHILYKPRLHFGGGDCESTGQRRTPLQGIVHFNKAGTGRLSPM